MLQYTLNIILFQFLFLLVYELFLKKETFFTYNRWYLLVTPVLSLILPLLELNSLGNAIPADTVILLPEIILGQENPAGMNGNFAAPGNVSQQFSPWWLLYGIGAVVSLLLLIRKYVLLKSLYKNKRIAGEGSLKIIEVPDSSLACTFFNTIFLGDRLTEEETQQILAHELVHVKQRHTADLLLFELLRIVFWFNPLIYIYQNRISTLHEFIADAGVVESVAKKDYYQQLLNTAFSTRNISFINQFFNHSLIKKRIVMLKKTRSKNTAKFKYLSLVPLLMVMLTYVAYAGQTDRVVDQTQQINQTTTSVLIEVEDLDNVTPEEKERIETATEKMQVQGIYNRVRVTDGERTLEMAVDPQTGAQEGKIYHNQENLEAVTDPLEQEIPFAIVEEAPVFPGCEEKASGEAKECMTQKITAFVNSNFDLSAVAPYAAAGQNKVLVRFKIDETGNVVDVEARYPGSDQEGRHATEQEAERVVKSLPKMKPGKHEGKEVGVLYALPIVF